MRCPIDERCARPRSRSPRVLARGALVTSLLLLAGCQSNPVDKIENVVVGPQSGSETHWLSSCDDGTPCQNGGTCLCGICTTTCEAPEACAEAGAGLGAAATCVPPGSAQSATLCGALPERGPGVCAAEGGQDEDCRVSGHRCVEGVCAPPPRAVEDRAGPQTRSYPVPARDAIDFLFVVDDSGSMCEEQAQLSRNFAEFAPLLTRVDYRVAVVSTDMLDRNGRLGRFLAEPAEPVPALNCLDAEGEPLAPDTADCPALVEAGRLPPILAPEDDADEALLANQFRCLATLGTGGDGFERGLDAMRTALSCAGPNAPRFGGCCRGGRYDRSCVGAAPDFLRPQASLVVVFVTDEDDCSPATDQEIGRSENSNCEWDRHLLEPVEAYRDFLVNLKGDPSRVSVWAFVGERAFTDAGDEIFFDRGRPAPICDPDEPAYDPETPASVCCPDGVCAGPIQPSCQSDLGAAYNGRRYADLANALPGGCSPDDGDCAICGGAFDVAGVFEQRAPVLLYAWCLDPGAACLVPGGDGTLRACRGDERRDATRYALTVEVFAEDSDTPVRVPAGALTVTPDEPGCGGAPLLQLDEPPPPGGRVRFRYLAE